MYTKDPTSPRSHQTHSKGAHASGYTFTFRLPRANLGPRALNIICGFVSSSASVTALDLSGNSFGNAGAGELALAVAHNPNLRSLDIRSTALTPQGFAMILEACSTASQLAVIDASSDSGFKGRMQLGVYGAQALSHLLATTTSVKKIHLKSW